MCGRVLTHGVAFSTIKSAVSSEVTTWDVIFLWLHANILSPSVVWDSAAILRLSDP